MADPVRLLFTNAAAAGLIALVAWAASRVLRHHAVVHALWLLALLKLVSPPLAPVPLLPSWTGEPLFFAPRTPTVAVIPAPIGADAALRNMLAEPATVQLSPSSATPRVLAPPAPRLVEATPARSAAGSPARWRVAVWTLLATGALAIGALAALRFRRFGRLLACARPAPACVGDRVSSLAAQLGVRRVPPVLLLPARIPPMLWPARRGPAVLMPESLIADLQADELDALLAHELAHVRRRDHWVRLLEIAATAFFWWYPVTWWARRALRRAEERCCDEWVLRVLPRSAQAYANGLLKSLTFVADSPLPAVASGLGPVEDLEARLKEILMTRPAPQLAVPIRFALAVAAVLGLAVFPTHAQPTREEPAEAAPVEKPAAAAPKAPAAAPAPAPEPATPLPPAKPARSAPAIAPAPPEPGVPEGARGGVPGGVGGGVPGGVAGGVPAPPLPARAATPFAPMAAPATLAPPSLAPMAAPRTALTPPPAAPALAPMGPLGPTPAAFVAPRARGPEQRAIDEQRRAIDDRRRQLHQEEIVVARKQMELDAQAEQAELRAEADRLRADGRAEDAERIEKRAALSSVRAKLQRRQLELEAERAALEAKLEAEEREHQDRLEAVEESGQEDAMKEAHLEVEHAEAARERVHQELEAKQRAIQEEMERFERQEQDLAAEEHVHAVRGATDELARSIAEQVESLKQAAADAPAQHMAIEQEIQRLQAALDALAAGAPTARRPKTPGPPSKTPAPAARPPQP
jgi:beta-lactamase regulating signal transducer with metallopeptidase domain